MLQSVIVYDPSTKDEQSKVRGVGRYIQILRENFPDWKFVAKYSVTPQPDIFINPFFNFLQKPLALRRIAKKQIAVIHDLIPLKYPKHFPIGIKGKLNVFLNKQALKNYDVVVTDSEASKKDIIAMLKVEDKKVKVIYPCLMKMFEVGGFTPNLKLPTSYCLYVGDATWNKNLVTIAKAIKEINVTCIFVGKVFDAFKTTNYSNPWKEELKEFYKMTKDDKRFILAGYVEDKSLINLYRQAKLNILLSRDEGFGFSYLEAASQACPSVLSDTPVFQEVAGEAALYSTLTDYQDAANKIGELYFNKNSRDELGFRAQEQAKSYSRKRLKSSFYGII